MYSRYYLYYCIFQIKKKWGQFHRYDMFNNSYLKHNIATYWTVTYLFLLFQLQFIKECEKNEKKYIKYNLIWYITSYIILSVFNYRIILMDLI